MSGAADTVGERLRTLFDPDPERAAEKYRELLHRLKKFFEWRQCAAPEDLAQDVMVRGLRRVREGVDIQRGVVHYFFGIAKLVVQEDRRAAARAPDPIPVDVVSAADGITIAEARICLAQVLARISADERMLLRRYHIDGREALQRDLGISAETLRVRVHRLHRRIQREVMAAAMSLRGVK